jgi:SAM-dependent methyltransferase
MTSDVKYIHTDGTHNTTAANAFIPILIEEIGLPGSVVDVGCGIGTWLSVFKANGVRKVLGIDGEYVDRKQLHIPEQEFITADLENPFDLNEKFDLAICLEVAEHLRPDAAVIIVNTLCNLSDKILFSAALPKQGGQNHLNEQSFEYWKKLFNDKGYLWKDVFRERIWMNKNIDWWYRQNMFLIEKLDNKPIQQDFINDYYHPELHMHYISLVENNQAVTTKTFVKNACKAVLRSALGFSKKTKS